MSVGWIAAIDLNNSWPVTLNESYKNAGLYPRTNCTGHCGCTYLLAIEQSKSRIAYFHLRGLSPSFARIALVSSILTPPSSLFLRLSRSSSLLRPSLSLLSRSLSLSLLSLLQNTILNSIPSCCKDCMQLNTNASNSMSFMAKRSQ